MGDYSYLPQQSEEHFVAHNRNDQSFIEFNPLLSCLICFPLEEQSSRQFQDFWNWFLNKHSAETYTAYTTYYFDQAYFENDFEERNNSINQLLYSATFEQQPPDFEYLNHQIHIWIAAHQTTETPFETEEKSYQTAPVFDLLSSKSDLSTQTVTPEPMANDPMQANILAALQGIQTALGRKNNTPIPLFRATTANQYDDEYKFQIVGGYFQGFSATWFSQKTDANAQQRIVRWTPTNIGEINTSFTTWFENKFRTPILISKWRMELERRTQGPVDTGRNWTKEQKIHSFTKGLKTDLLYALWSLLALKNNPTMDMTIELAQRIEDNQRMYLGSTLPVFASVPVMAPAPQIALIDRLTANLARLLEPLAQAVRENQQPQRPRFEPRFNQPQQPPYQRQQNCGPPVCYHCELTGHFSRDCNNPPLPPPVPRNNDAQNNRINNNNVSNQRPNYANINFFGEDPLVEATSESASQPEENPFYTFNLTDDDHDMDELAINPSESTRKKKKAKVDFVLDPNKASTSTADNNEPPKAKVFKNPPKLKPPKIVQKSDLRKSLIPKKKTPKTNKHPCQARLADNSNVTLLICKVQVAGYFIDLILDNGSSKKELGIAKAIPVCINDISIETDMEVFEAKEYTIIVGNKWLKKAKALLDYELCELTIRCGEKLIVVKCCHWTTPPVPKQSPKENESDESDNEESKEKEKQKEQKETAKLAYTIFTNNDKPLDNVKADKEGIIVNGKLICWPYYNMLRRTFDRKPDKKAKYSYCDECMFCLIYYKDWKPISLIPRKEIKEVQKSFENKPPEIQSLVVEQREPFSEEKNPVISKEGEPSECTHVIQHTIITRETCSIHLKLY
ncbi:hypothetical protein G9A89_021306 [Geosiphon pyriformis]|nr:hypothetical protein G9A89_021306 [Geosiphon pyriformis]